jgi:hypothetical protein
LKKTKEKEKKAQPASSFRTAQQLEGISISCFVFPFPFAFIHYNSVNCEVSIKRRRQQQQRLSLLQTVSELAHWTGHTPPS